MKLPVIQGIIRRRILANFRVEAEVMQQQLPDVHISADDLYV